MQPLTGLHRTYIEITSLWDCPKWGIPFLYVESGHRQFKFQFIALLETELSPLRGDSGAEAGFPGGAVCAAFPGTEFAVCVVQNHHLQVLKISVCRSVITELVAPPGRQRP